MKIIDNDDQLDFISNIALALNHQIRQNVISLLKEQDKYIDYHKLHELYLKKFNESLHVSTLKLHIKSMSRVNLIYVIDGRKKTPGYKLNKGLYKYISVTFENIHNYYKYNLNKHENN